MHVCLHLAKINDFSKLPPHLKSTASKPGHSLKTRPQPRNQATASLKRELNFFFNFIFLASPAKFWPFNGTNTPSEILNLWHVLHSPLQARTTLGLAVLQLRTTPF
jgi:hypothetical protein